jgi:hypothetical protein
MQKTLTQLCDVVGGPFYADPAEKLAAVQRILWPPRLGSSPPPVDDPLCRPPDGECPF